MVGRAAREESERDVRATFKPHRSARGLPAGLRRSTCPSAGLGTVFSSLDAVLEVLDSPALTAEHTAMFGVEESEFRTVRSRNVAAMTSAPRERHDRLRSLLQPSFTRRRIDRLRPRILEVADRLAAELPRHADANGVVDVVEHYARRLALRTDGRAGGS